MRNRSRYLLLRLQIRRRVSRASTPVLSEKGLRCCVAWIFVPAEVKAAVRAGITPIVVSAYALEALCLSNSSVDDLRGRKPCLHEPPHPCRPRAVFQTEVAM